MKFYLRIDRVMVSAAMYYRRNLSRFSVFSVQKQRYFIYTDIKVKTSSNFTSEKLKPDYI